MTQQEIRAEAERLAKVQARTTAKVAKLQAACAHPSATKVNKASVGHYDPSCDSYWRECRCPDCGLFWTEPQ